MRIMSLLAALLLSVGCADAQGPAAPNSNPQQPNSDPYRLIVRVEGRTDVILIESGLAGVVYTVKNRDRQLVIDRATLAQLKQQQPEIEQKLQRTIVWAGL